MTEKLRGIFIDTYGSRRPQVRVLPDDSLTAFYTLLDCSFIDTAVAVIDGVQYDVIFDDEGRGRVCYDPEEGPAPSVYVDDTPVIFGPCFICKGSEETGEQVSLTPEECDAVLSRIVVKRYRAGPVDTHGAVLILKK